jgi:hypothetical protein
MVEFSEYVSIAYEIADEKGFRNQLQGSGSQPANQNLMSELAAAYNANDHSEATRSEAYSFLQANLGPP